MRLAKERRQVGGQGVGEGFPFTCLWLPLEAGQIITEVSKPMMSQPLGKTAINHLALVLSEHDTRSLIDEFADAGKILLG